MLPSSMKAVRMFEYGDPSVLKYLDVPLPEMAEDEVLIRVRATSVTRWDLLFRAGFLRATEPGRPPLAMPSQLGREAAGEVAAVGAKVTRFKPGDRVVAMVSSACGHCEFCKRGLDNLCIDTTLPGHQRFGGYAEYVSRKETEVLHAPASVPFEKLGCCLWSYAFVWRMAFTRGGLQAGQSVLITAASSGLGTAAVQLARLAGASPILGTTGSATKVDLLKEVGCDYALNYKEVDVPERAHELTNGLGVDLVLDMVGGDMFTMGLACLRMGGTLVPSASHGGLFANVNITQIFVNELNIRGTRGQARRDQEVVLRLLEEGKIDPYIYKVLPLEEAAEAHGIMERQEHFGKIVLTP